MGKRTNTAKWLENQKRWQINVQKDGVRRSFTSSKPGRTGQREANGKADAWLDDGIERSNIRVEKAYQLYMKDLKSRTGRGNWESQQSVGKKWIIPCKGFKRVSSLNDQDLQDIINTAYQKGKLSRKSLINIRQALTAFLKFCRKNKFCAFRPEDVIIPQSATRSKKEILQPQHLITLFTSSKTMYDRKVIDDPYINAYRFQVLTGFRPGELIALSPNDVFGSTVHILRSKNIYGEITQGKNEDAVRAYSLPPLAHDILYEEMEKGCEYIFGIRSEPHYRNRWKAYCKYNGIPYIPPYNLRHTFVSVVKVLPEGAIKPIVGHSKNMDTFGFYGHYVEGDDKKVSSMIQGVFDGILKGAKEKVC